MTKKNIYLHIGTSKTGSTSIQHFLRDHIDTLRQSGFDLYNGMYDSSNHIELFLATMNYDRDSFAKTTFKVDTNREYTKQITRRLNRYIGESDFENIIFTTEGLFRLRYSGEILRLKKILNSNFNNIKIILYLRDKKDFLESYKKQILKVDGRNFSTDPKSSLYVEDDTWMLDYEKLISLYKKGFGEDRIQVIDYDVEVGQRSTVLPSFLDAINIPAEKFSDISDYFLNKTEI